MKEKPEFIVTEWEWFKIKLDISALQRRSEVYTVSYEFDDIDEKIKCSIYNTYTEELLVKNKTKASQLKIYKGWVEIERIIINDILPTMPLLYKKFNFKNDIKFLIMDFSGMSSFPICEIIGDKVTWRESDA